MKETKAETILVWMTADQKDWLRRRAEAEDASMSWIIRQAIRNFMLSGSPPDPSLTNLVDTPPTASVAGRRTEGGPVDV